MIETESLLPNGTFTSFFCSTKLNASSDTIKLVLSHRHCVTTVVSTQDVHLFKGLFCDWLKTLTSIPGWNMHKHQKNLHRCLAERENPVVILSHMQAGASERKSRI